jgi:hypothetical protein
MRFSGDMLGPILTGDQGWAQVHLTSQSKQLPIRGFTAYAPESYTLESQTFRDDPRTRSFAPG